MIPDARFVEHTVEKPAATPVEFIAVPRPKCWMLSKRGVAFAASVASS